MTGISEVSTQYPAEATAAPTRSPWQQTVIKVVRNAVIVAAAALAFSVLLGGLLHPLLAELSVEEEFTRVLADVVLVLLPFGIYLTIGVSARSLRQEHPLPAAGITLAAVLMAFLIVTLVQSVNSGDDRGGLRPSLQFDTVQTDEGVLVEAVEPDGAAAAAGIQVGDVITAIRRDAVTLEELNSRVAEAEENAPFRLRILRDGEEIQLTVRTVLVTAAPAAFDYGGLLAAALVASIIGLMGLYGPAGWAPYVLLALSLSPLLLGYAWLLIATFSYRTHGLMPVDANDQFGGLTLDNWGFLTGQGVTDQIWSYTLNSLVIAVSMTVVSLLLSSMAGYALSRMEFSGRRFFLSLTLILHSFPAVTLLIPVYLVLLMLGDIPILGPYIGFNSLGGIALVMVSFGLPFGVWLMKGFFDNISWDMERSALIDGATRWRTFWEIILPQIRPGLLALGVFSFMGGWNAYLIPAIFSVGTKTANLPVYIRQLTGEVSPVNWNQVAAVGLFQMIPILLLFVFAQEYLLNIYSGGSKGSS